MSKIKINENIKENIIFNLKELSKKYNIKILFAVETGSRVWGIESKNSDYDIRFVFIKPIKEYLKLTKSRDVIEYKEVDDLDFVGFDIYKFCILLRQSNPTVIEWLLSDIIYMGKIPEPLLAYAEAFHKRIALFYHYVSMAKNNYFKYLKSKRDVTYKKYLYAMRGILNAKWVKTFPTLLPPLKLNDTIYEFERKVSDEIPKNILKDLKLLIKLKKEGKEKTLIKNIVRIDSFIEDFFKTEEFTEKEGLKPNEKLLDDFILKKLLK